MSEPRSESMPQAVLDNMERHRQWQAAMTEVRNALVAQRNQLEDAARDLHFSGDVATSGLTLVISHLYHEIRGSESYCESTLRDYEPDESGREVDHG